MPSSPRSFLRLDVQTLRVFAILAVVAYHFWPGVLPAGFIGVDVFFVVSSFLITGHLVREWSSTGHIGIARFLARRARRLLPAALVVIAATAAITAALVPRAFWAITSRDVLGSVAYVENWVLARFSVDYLAVGDSASPLQHFWSLAVEEQFYLVWPLVILAALGIRRRILRRRRARLSAPAAVAIAAGVVLASSLIHSIVFTDTFAAQAYFVSTTRAWEFAAGALIAALPPARISRRLRAGSAVAGWALLAGSLIAITASTPYPGATALLPVAGAALVLVGGHQAPAAVMAAYRFPLLRPVAEGSYSLYLVHWPALVLAAEITGHPLDLVQKLVLLGVVAVATWLLHRFVENPFRQSARSNRVRPRTVFASVTLACLVIAIPVAATAHHFSREVGASIDAAHGDVATEPGCWGADDRRDTCAPRPAGTIIPAPWAASGDNGTAWANSCLPSDRSSTVRSCTYGSGPVRVALVGDSHAASLDAAMRVLADERGWTVTTYLKSACPLTTSPDSSGDATLRRACDTWRSGVLAAVDRSAPFDLVLVTHSTSNAPTETRQREIHGYRAAWSHFTSRGATIVAIRDVPRAPTNAAACLERNPTRVELCSFSRSDAFPPHPDLMVAAADADPDATSIDLSDAFCTGTVCPSAVGGVVVFRDTHHVTGTFSQTLAEPIGEALDAALKAKGS